MLWQDFLEWFEWQHVEAQCLTKTLYIGFSFNLSPICRMTRAYAKELTVVFLVLFI